MTGFGSGFSWTLNRFFLFWYWGDSRSKPPGNSKLGHLSASGLQLLILQTFPLSYHTCVVVGPRVKRLVAPLILSSRRQPKVFNLDLTTDNDLLHKLSLSHGHVLANSEDLCALNWLCVMGICFDPLQAGLTQQTPTLIIPTMISPTSL